MWAIIGGSGFESFDGFETLEELSVDTPFGSASSGLRRVTLDGKQCLFLSRHGSSHELLPSEVNYRANIFALKKAGARKILSFSAVGSLKKKLKPGDLVVPHQYIDRTKSIRKTSFCGEGIVGHVSLAKPVCQEMTAKLKSLVSDMNFDSHIGHTYICIEGPYFSTKAESSVYRSFEADIIGMTNFPEYALAREAGMSYLPCCFVTDYDCWDDTIEHVTLEEVIKVMRENNSKAFEVAKLVVVKSENIAKSCECKNQGLKTGLMTSFDQISKEQKSWLEVLLA